MLRFYKYAFCLLVLFSIAISSYAQEKISGYDTNYVESNSKRLLLRLYTSKKYTDLVSNVPGVDKGYRFMPNTGLNLGLGFTYQAFTLNIAAPLSFMNPDRYTDWPKYFDLQAHAYPKNFIIDFLGQFYKGYSIEPKFLQNSNEAYPREDLRLTTIGLNVNYLLYGEKLSLQASFNQSEIQKKSAFSPFVGFEAYGGSVKGDSLLLPATELIDATINFAKSRYFQAGPNAGLAGTLVFGGGFFLTGVASANLSLGFSEWENQEVSKKWGVVPTYFLRGFFGYNNRRFSINANYVYKHSNLVKVEDFNNSINTGNYRINLIYKINVSEKFARGFHKINPFTILGLNK
ncbi:DUF4421 domain-containing protein [Algoriphagus sp.]|uniref:DUF4421 domain-containing protein n=1 Tax=Algoriphagus sp. TaxID=1872435 RepID=UPI0025E2EE9F|nr:DUF4421 domain-containing protein [Algoriphagus sp.]